MQNRVTFLTLTIALGLAHWANADSTGIAPQAPPPPTSRQLPLTTKEVDFVKTQIEACWNVSAGASKAQNLRPEFRVQMNPDGTVRSAVLLNADRLNDPLFQEVADSAHRALLNPRCQPLKLPADKYGQWQTFTITFDPADFSLDPPTTAAQMNKQSVQEHSVAMRQVRGVFVVPVVINEIITLNFVVDSGAADVSVPADVVLTLMRTGSIQQQDFLGAETYILADGSTVPSQTFRIRSLRVGDITLQNVLGAVAPVQGELLLGQSFLGRFKSWSIDNVTHSVILQ